MQYIIQVQQLQALALQQAVWGISCLVLLPSSCNYSSLRPWASEGFFPGEASRVFSQNFFQGGGQKWWNLVLTPWNWKNNLFLLIISKYRGAKSSLSPPSDAHACAHPSAIIVKSQKWPTPSESIAIYCVRKLVSCVTHFQSRAKVDISNKKKNYVQLLWSKLKITKLRPIRTPPLNIATKTVKQTRSFFWRLFPWLADFSPTYSSGFPQGNRSL